MPPLIVAVLAGAAAFAGFRAAKAIWTQVSAPPQSPDPVQADDRTPGETNFKKDLGTLEYDATTGVYRPTQPMKT